MEANTFVRELVNYLGIKYGSHQSISSNYYAQFATLSMSCGKCDMPPVDEIRLLEDICGFATTYDIPVFDDEDKHSRILDLENGRYLLHTYPAAGRTVLFANITRLSNSSRRNRSANKSLPQPESKRAVSYTLRY